MKNTARMNCFCVMQTGMFTRIVFSKKINKKADVFLVIEGSSASWKRED